MSPETPEYVDRYFGKAGFVLRLSVSSSGKDDVRVEMRHLGGLPMSALPRPEPAPSTESPAGKRESGAGSRPSRDQGPAPGPADPGSGGVARRIGIRSPRPARLAIKGP